MLLPLMLLACSDYALDDVGGDPTLEAWIEVSPPSLDMGQLEPGETSSEAFTLTARGDRAVHISDVSVLGSDSFTLTWLGELSLAVDESVDVVVDYSPAAVSEDAQVQIQSDGAEPIEFVALHGEGLIPMLRTDPTEISLQSYDGEAVTAELTVISSGSATLQVYDQVLIGSAFDVPSLTPVTLEPGEQTTVKVTWTPGSAYDVGELWLSANTAAGSHMVPLEGELRPVCYGMAEAWERGSMALSMQGGRLHVENADPDVPLCIDTWYIYISVDTQDAGAGDPMFDPGADYPTGTITLEPGQEVSFPYGRPSQDAWWCVEQTQSTYDTSNFEFIGARVPWHLREHMLDGVQDDVWQQMQDQPLVVVGRTRGVVELAPGDDERVGVVAINMGRADVDAEISEVIPAGFTASDFSVTPDERSTDDDGNLSLTWYVPFDAAIDTALDEHTVYDRVQLSYTLSRTSDAECTGRLTGPEPRSGWYDSDGTERYAVGSPLIIQCNSVSKGD